MKWFEGYKSYIVGGLMILLAIAKGQGWVTTETFVEVSGILAGMGLWTLRAGITTEVKK